MSLYGFRIDPDPKYMARAWEKDGRKDYYDSLMRVDSNAFDDRDEDYVRSRLRFEYAKSIEDGVRIYALWLKHSAEKREIARQAEDTNQQAWSVLRKALEAKRAGRKTIRIDDLLKEVQE